MILAEGTGWLSRVDWNVLIVVLQVVTLGYLVFAFRRVARNQVDLARGLKELLESKPTQDR